MKNPLVLLKKLDEIVVASLVALITLIMTLQVFFRFVLNAPLIWSEELSRHLFVWAAMLGLGYSIRTGIDISMSMFVKLMPRFMQMLIQVVTDAFVIVVYAITIPAAIDYTMQQHNIITSATVVPRSFLTISVPIGFSLLIFQLCIRIFKTVAGYFGEREKNDAIPG